MNHKFRPPVVWITGASRGIGKEIALQFSYIGCKVALSSTSPRDLIIVKKLITKLGGTAEVFRCDLTKEKEVKSAYRAIEKIFGSVDVLVNDAGVTSFNSFETTTLKEFDNILDVNLRAAFICTKLVLPAMVKNRDGWIFNIASVVALKTFCNSSAYTAAKAGLNGMSRVVREEVRKHNIKVVTVFPGATATEMWDKKNLAKFSKRMMNPATVAEAILNVFKSNREGYVEELVIRPISGDID